MSEKLTIVEQKEVTFYNDELTAVLGEDGRVYVSIRHMCEALGIDNNAQQQRIRRHTVLNNGRRACKLHALDKRSSQTNFVLRVDLIPLWLSGIRTSAVKEEVRSKLEKFQEEAAAVLWEAFQEGRLTADTSFDELLKSASADTLEAYQMAMALVKLARNQIILESRLDEHGRVLEDYGRRLETIEADMHQEDRYITEAQATQISQAVRAIAMDITKRSGKNEFGRTWGEFYRKFGVSKYRNLPVSKFEEALAWLEAWYAQLTDNEIPF